jgi:hypothetical protein
MWALKERTEHVEAFHEDTNFRIVRTGIDPLASGVIADNAKAYIARRSNDVRGDRSVVIKHLQNNPHIKAELKGITEETLREWLVSETLKPNGIASLARRIRHYSQRQRYGIPSSFPVYLRCSDNGAI